MCINHPLVHHQNLIGDFLRKGLGTSLSLAGWRLWLGKMLWGSAFLSDIGLLSVLFTPWVPHCTKQQNMLSASLPFLMSYYKLLKGKIAVQSLDRYTEYMCVLFHPFQFTTRFYLFVIMRKWGVYEWKRKWKTLLFFPGCLTIDACLFQMKGRVCLRWRENILVLLPSHEFRKDCIFLFITQTYQ